MTEPAAVPTALRSRDAVRQAWIERLARFDAAKPGTGRVVLPAEEYLAFLPDRCPAYISREHHEAIQRRIAENRARADSKGSVREGPSLLAGLVSCVRCGYRMAVHYSGRGRYLRYVCESGAASCGPPLRSITGRVLDHLVSEQVLAALQPGALELSLAAADDVLRERERLDTNWQQRLERARYQAERAERQYRVVEPENRLVARSLERQWEATDQPARRVSPDRGRIV